MRAKNFLKQHFFLVIILLLHLILSLAYTSTSPLGEAPDEPAHLSYARFIAEHNRLPATLGERREAGYRSTWPPLYHLVVSIPLNLIGDTPPTHLKSVGDTPRRLIPTNGQTIAAFIHTADEAWPWRGITLAWHLGRSISVFLTLLTISLTYTIAWRLTRQRLITAGATALHAFLPQALFIGTVVNDDNLLIFLSSLILLFLIYYSQQANVPDLRHFLILGALLGLATVAKYNALPLWIVTIVWLILLNQTKSPSPQTIKNLFITILILLVGAALTAGWWIIFIWRNFNQVNTLGPISGSLAAVSAGTADASLRQLSTGSLSISLPPPAAWLEWCMTLFKSFWGLFGGGSTIELPSWGYGFLAFICLIPIISLIIRAMQRTPNRNPPSPTPYVPLLPTPYFLFLIPLLFLPLPFVRFILSGSIVETAQGRHLFPALPLISLGLVWGLSSFAEWVSSFKFRVSGFEIRNTQYAIRVTSLFPLILPISALGLSLYSLHLISTSYPPLIPLRTTTDAAVAENQPQASLTDDIKLIGYELDQPKDGMLPIALIWQADSIPTEDYLIDLSLVDPTGEPLGNWIGHPVGGRYPTRAWDEGDILRDTISIPLLANPNSTEAILSINLLNTFNESIAPAVTSQINLPISRSPNLPISPTQLRADGLAPDATFSYRSTLSFILPGQATPPELIAPNEQAFAPVRFTSNSITGIAHFIVAANWPSGIYQLETQNSTLETHIINRPRQFDLPPMTKILNANFGNQLTILGYDIPQNRVQPGESFPITLHLQAQRTMGRDLTIFNHLLDANSIQRGGADRKPQNYYTTLLWVPQEIVSDSYKVPVEANAPFGIYWLDVGLYPADQPSFSLPLVVDGRPIERNSVSLGPIKVGGPPPELIVTDAEPQNFINASFGDEITLLGFNLTDPNDNPITNLSLFWQANTVPQADYTVFIHLLDSEGNLIAQADSPPAAGTYPTSLWDADEIVIDKRQLPELASGHYTIQVGLYRTETGERLPTSESSDGSVRLIEFEIKQ